MRKPCSTKAAANVRAFSTTWRWYATNEACEASRKATALAAILAYLPKVLAGNVVTTRFDWLPQLGLNAEFRLADRA